MGAAEALNLFMAGAPSTLRVRGCAAFGAIDEVLFHLDLEKQGQPLLGVSLLGVVML